MSTRILHRPNRPNLCRRSPLVVLLAAALVAPLQAAGPVAGPFPELAPVIEDNGQEVRMTAKSDHLELSVVYPRLSGEPMAAVGTMTVAAKVDELVRDFEAQYRGSLTDDGGQVGPPWALDVSYDELYSTPGLWAVGLSVYQYTGGAHGSTTAIPVVIARQTGGLVPPAGLFRRDADWLPVLSQACYEDLAGREPFEPDDDWLKQGTAPVPENYAALLPRAEGLQVSFQQYQVGPYAIGAFEVVVPWARLAGLLEPALFGDLAAAP